MMWGYGFGWGWLMMTFGTVFWIALLVVLVWAVIRLLSSRASGPAPQGTTMPPGGPSAMEILRQRYARGEIDEVTFEHMRERLERGKT